MHGHSIIVRLSRLSAAGAAIAFAAGCPLGPGGDPDGNSPDGGDAADGTSIVAGDAVGDGSLDGGGDGGPIDGGGTAGGDGQNPTDGTIDDPAEPDVGGAAPTLANLQVFPADNPWNQDVSGLPVHPNSAAYMASIGLDRTVHPDFGTVYNGAPIGIPFVVVPADQPKLPVAFLYADESDPGPYPIPPNPPIEGGPQSSGDRHILMVDPAKKILYELYAAYPPGVDPHELGVLDRWTAGSGAIWNLTSNDLRPAGWTSADAAGLPVFAGLARYDEVVERGEITHALRFTARYTQRAYILPATHWASSSTDPNRPPMGLRVRLKASFDITPYSANVRVILRGLQKYGMLLADNGSDWYISGAPDPRWDDDELRQLRQVRGSDFEAVYTGPLVTP